MLCWRGRRDLAAAGQELHLEVILSLTFLVFFPILSFVHL